MAIDLNIFSPVLSAFAQDSRITVWHMAILWAMIQLSEIKELQTPFGVSRRKIMDLAHIRSLMTYHKCIRELQQYGYIRYTPSYHPAFGSEVQILVGNEMEPSAFSS